jgi:hypothetical protein
MFMYKYNFMWVHVTHSLLRTKCVSHAPAVKGGGPAHLPGGLFSSAGHMMSAYHIDHFAIHISMSYSVLIIANKIIKWIDGHLVKYKSN